MKSDASTDRITVSGIREDVLDRLDALADAQDTSRSALVVELIEAEVADAVPDGSGEYLPVDDRLREVYEAVLDVATMPDHTLRFDLYRGELASKTGIGQKAVRGNLFRLQEKGYVKHQHGDAQSDLSRETYRIKPRCSNPKAWKFSDARDPRAVESLEGYDPEVAD